MINIRFDGNQNQKLLKRNLIFQKYRNDINYFKMDGKLFFSFKNKDLLIRYIKEMFINEFSFINDSMVDIIDTLALSNTYGYIRSFKDISIIIEELESRFIALEKEYVDHSTSYFNIYLNIRGLINKKLTIKNATLKNNFLLI